jgi:hypothetical protein
MGERAVEGPVICSDAVVRASCTDENGWARFNDRRRINDYSFVQTNNRFVTLKTTR